MSARRTRRLSPLSPNRSRGGRLKSKSRNFDLMTGFSLVPLQIFALFGFVVAAGGVAFGIFLGIRRLIVGAEVEGVFTLFAILFTVLGVVLAGLGIVGEYIGRIYQEVRRRPRFSVRRMYGETLP